MQALKNIATLSQVKCDKDMQQNYLLKDLNELELVKFSWGTLGWVGTTKSFRNSKHSSWQPFSYDCTWGLTEVMCLTNRMIPQAPCSFTLPSNLPLLRVTTETRNES